MSKNTILKFLNRWGPERFPRLIYNHVLTPVRGLIFYVIILFFTASLFIDLRFTYPVNFGPDIFRYWSIKMMYLLFAMGAFTASFFTIVIKTIKMKQETWKVTSIWANLVKYTLYHFATAIVIAVVLFLMDIGKAIPELFPLFLLFVFLTMNSLYVIIRMAEILVNENYSPVE